MTVAQNAEAETELDEETARARARLAEALTRQERLLAAGVDPDEALSALCGNCSTGRHCAPPSWNGGGSVANRWRAESRRAKKAATAPPMPGSLFDLTNPEIRIPDRIVVDTNLLVASRRVSYHPPHPDAETRAAQFFSLLDSSGAVGLATATNESRTHSDSQVSDWPPPMLDPRVSTPGGN